MATTVPSDATAWLNRLRGHRYVVLETYRADGTPVRTPMWFVIHEGQVYMRTLATAGKIKRIARNPAARLAPCDLRGRPLGPWTAARARIVTGEEALRASQMLRRRYGWRWVVLDTLSRVRGHAHTVLALELTAQVR
jgi:PPOX class probable F420-dependent enzyme